jgi:hypothetical protein
MGAWSSKPFGNDTALDWVSFLETSLDSNGILNALDIVKNEKIPDSKISEEGYAACCVVLAASQEKPSKVPPEVKEWIKYSAYVPTENDLELSIHCLQKIIENSELRDLWKETSSFKTWNKGIRQLLANLNAVDKESLPHREKFIPKSLHKLFAYPNVDENNDIQSMLMTKLRNLKDVNKESAATAWELPLMLAMQHGNLDAAKLLFSMGANFTDSQGRTMLSLACQNNLFEVVKMLLEKGVVPIKMVDCNVRSNTYQNDEWEIADDFTVRWPENYPFKLALENKSTPIETVKLLIQYGSDLKGIDINGYSSLYYAVNGGNQQIIQYILESNSIDINFQNGGHKVTALFQSVCANNLAIVKLLLKFNGNPNIPDRHNRTCLDMTKNEQMRKILIGSGAKISSELGLTFKV